MADIDYTLRNQVDRVQNAVLALDRSLSVVGQRVETVSSEQRETRSELTALRHDFLRFIQQAELTANVQRSETKVGALEGRVEHEFGHYKVVRRTAVGVLQAFDVGLVSQEAVRAVGEQLMVQTPRYWLAPVLVALSAWVGDDPDLCDRAVNEAFRRSPSKTSLFMALVLRRQRRHANAGRWLRHYLNAQDPRALGRDFAVILESISQGAFGVSGLDLAREYLDRWRAQLISDEAAQQAQVDRWRAEIDSHIRPSSGGARFPRLASVSPQWPLLERALSCAESQKAIIDKYTAMMAEEITPSARLEDAVDDILDRLVAEYDNEELPLRRELAYHHAVIAQGGDLVASKRTIDADAASFEVSLDYLTIETSSALHPAAIGVSRATQRLAVAACHEWFARSHAAFSRDYRLSVPSVVEATFEGNHNAGGVAFSLPRWTGSFAQPTEVLERSLADHWDRSATPFIDRMAYPWRQKAILPGILVFLGLVLISMCTHSVLAGLIIALIAGGICAGVLYSRNGAAVARQNHARALLAAAKQDSLARLRGAAAELTDWSSAYRTADTYEAELAALIAGLATATQAALPYDTRAVLPVREGSVT